MTSWSIPTYTYRSVTPGRRPTALADGQLFINQPDQVMCVPNSAGGGTFVTEDLAPQLGASQPMSAPPSGKVSYGYTSVAKRELLGMQGSASALTPLQPMLGYSRLALWSGIDGSGAMYVADGQSPPQLGTPTPRYTNALSSFNRFRRIGYVSATTVGAFAGLYTTLLCWYLGNGTAQSGFLAQFTFGCADAAAVAGARQFVGMTTTNAAPTNVDPAGLTNVIGLGHGAADTTLKLYCAGSAAQTPIDLGSSFPANTLGADMYRLTLWAARDGSINWQVDRLGTTISAAGTFANATPGTTAPSASVELAPRAWRCNNSTALAVSLDIAVISILTDGY